MKVVRSTYRRVRSFFTKALRPPTRDVEAYARLIAEREGRSLDACWHEAELQLWAWRSENRPSGRTPGGRTHEVHPA